MLDTVIGHDAKLPNLQSLPVEYQWELDTAPPSVMVDPVSNSGVLPIGPQLNSTALTVACTGEAAPALCQLCVQVEPQHHTFSVAESTTVCNLGAGCSPRAEPPAGTTANEPQAGLPCTVLVDVPPADDVYVVRVWSLDAAGNAGSPVVVSLTRDTIAPVLEMYLLPEPPSGNSSLGEVKTWAGGE